MLDNSNKSNRTLDEILESLSVKEETYDTFYQTRSREDYDLLLNAALNGNLEGVISVGHSAIYRDKIRVSPPSEISN
jgi:ATP-dependent DNA ligase